jgi:hypothetical protein
MANRDELSKLYGKSKVFLVGKQNNEEDRARVTLTPLSLDDMGLFDTKMDGTASEQKEQTLLLLAKSMDVSVDDLRSVSVAYLEEIFGYVMEINNINTNDVDKLLKIKESLKK